MRIIKVILGVVCLAFGLFLNVVAFIVPFTIPGGIHLRATSRFMDFGIVSAYAFCGVVLAGLGIFLIVRRNSVLLKQTQAMVAAGVFASISISTGVVLYVHAHKMSGAQLIEEDLKLLDSARDQYSTESDTPTYANSPKP